LHNKNRNVQPKRPVVNQNLIKENQNSYALYQEALEQAKMKAVEERKSDKELSLKLKDTRLALEKEIQRQLVEQLKIRAKNRSVTPDQQALIEKLYIDLRLINAELAFSTLKSFAIYEAKKRASEQNKPLAGHAELVQRQEDHRQHRPQPKQVQLVQPQPQPKVESQNVKFSAENLKQYRAQQESQPLRSQEQAMPKAHHPHPNSRSHPNLHVNHSRQQLHLHPNGQSHQQPQRVPVQIKSKHNTISRSASKPNQDHPQELVHNRGSIVNSNSAPKHKPSNANKPIAMPERSKQTA